MKDLKILEFLGEGGFGKVFKAFQISTSKLVAIKIFSSKNKINDICLEDNLLSAVEEINEHNKFISYYGLFKDSSIEINNPQLIIMMESGDINLQEILESRKREFKEYKIENLLYILKSLVEDYLTLQINGIATRDIKANNIILIPNELNPNLFYYKISDFGVGCLLRHDQEEIDVNKSAGMTEYYASNEVKLIYNRNYNKKTYNPFKADVFSLGILILEMIYMEKNDFLKKHDKKNDLHLLLLKMLNEDPDYRISFKEVYNEINSIIIKNNIKLENQSMKGNILMNFLIGIQMENLLVIK